MNKIETWCPLFSGFYNTIWEMDCESEIESYCEEENDDSINYDDFEINYKEYMQDVCKSFVEAVEKDLVEIGIKLNIQKVISPREYNFDNDSINIEVVVENFKVFREKIIKYLDINEEEWEEYLESRYTGCDGFIPSYPNTIDGWKEETNNYAELDGHYLGSILEFYLQNEQHKEMDYYDYVIENIYVGEYMTRIKKHSLENLGD